MLLNKIFLVNIHTIILMSFWLIGISLVSTLFSGELTAKLGLKTQVKQIDTIEELADSHLKLVMLEGMIAYKNSIDNQFGLLDKIYNKAKKENTLIIFQQIFQTILTNIRQIFDEKWIKGVSNGENAIFLFEILMKIIINRYSKLLGNKCRFRFLPEYYSVFNYLTIAMSKRLNKQFRHELNLRFAKYKIFI